MPKETRVVIIGTVEVEFPAQCVGNTWLTTCPELTELQNVAGQTESIAARNSLGSTAAQIGRRALTRNCRGCVFSDSDSGFTWIKKCLTTGKTEESN